jgi:hypothetical protein
MSRLSKAAVITYQNRLWTSLFISFAIAAITCSQTFTLPKIEPKPLQEDFQIARTALEQGHSGIYILPDAVSFG